MIFTVASVSLETILGMVVADVHSSFKAAVSLHLAACTLGNYLRCIAAVAMDVSILRRHQFRPQASRADG